MALTFESALGIHEDTFKLRARRAELLADNMANADTPNYKARDLDFREALARHTGGGESVAMARTHDGHLEDLPGGAGPGVKYRVPQQPSIDGNTVEEQVEHAAYMRNALDFQTSFQFLSNKFKGLSTALKGQSQ